MILSIEKVLKKSHFEKTPVGYTLIMFTPEEIWTEFFYLCEKNKLKKLLQVWLEFKMLLFY